LRGSRERRVRGRFGKFTIWGKEGFLGGRPPKAGENGREIEGWGGYNLHKKETWRDGTTEYQIEY